VITSIDGCQSSGPDTPGLVHVHLGLPHFLRSMGLVIREDVEPSLSLLLEPHVTDFVQLLLIIPHGLGKTSFPSLGLHIVANLEPFPFIFLPEVSLIEPLLIFNFHINWVVHQSLTTSIRRLYLTFELRWATS